MDYPLAKMQNFIKKQFEIFTKIVTLYIIGKSMRFKTKHKIFIMLILIMLMIVVLPVAQTISYAADTQITESDMNDTNLYNKLRSLGGGLVRSETFNKEKYHTVRLNGVTTSNTESNIVDLSGLTLFRFDYTTTLDLSNNNIVSVTSDILSVFPNLEELILSNNKIKHVDLSRSYNLKRIILDNNELEQIDLSEVNPTDAVIDLSCNRIKSFDSITLPWQTVNVSTKIDLYNNNITDFESAPVGYTINLGLQGFSVKDGKIEKNQKMAYYKTNDDQAMKTVIISGSDAKYTFYSGAGDNKTDIELPHGDYHINYYFTGNGTDQIVSTKTFTVRTGDDYYRDYFRYYKYSQFQVVPTAPTYTYIVGDTEYKSGDEFRINQKTTINLSGDSDCKLMYSVAGSEWKEGNSIELTRGGRYTISVKAVSLDGNFESENVTIIISAEASLTFPSILIVMLIIIGAVVVFGVGFPLLRKYVL